MTSENREEIELLKDTLMEHHSKLDDFLAEEVDDIANLDASDRKGLNLAAFNSKMLKKANRQLAAVMTTLQEITDKNA